jgi:hypothetical protein
MRIQIDQTGFHSAGRCLDHVGLGTIDVRGLLQFALEIIFSEEIIVSGFESGGVLGRTETLVQRLRSEGLDSEAVQIRPYTIEYYAKVCEEAATRFADDFEYAFSVETVYESTSLLALRPDLLPHELAVEENVHALIKSDRSQQELEEIAETSLQEKAVGSIAFMLSRCHPLWLKVRNAAKSDLWTPQTTQQLVAASRYYVTDSLAQSEKALHTPAVARAELLRASNKAFISTISSIVVDAAEKFKSKPLGIPSLSDVLVQKSKGDPVAVIAGAIRYRAMATDLRKYLSEKLSVHEMDTPNWHHELQIRVKELAWALEKELNPTERPHLLDAISIQISPLPFSVALNVIREWNQFRALRKYVILLTELSKELAFSQTDPYALNKLVNSSTRNRYIT